MIMSDYTKGRRFKDDKETKELNELARRQEELRAYRKFQCDHNNFHSEPILEPYADPKATVLASNPDNVYCCKDCGAVFELTTFSKEDFARWAFQQRSAFEQMKSLVNMSDAEYEEITKAISAIENLRDVGWRYYNRCILQTLGNGKKQKQKQNQKGSINIAGGFNRR